MQAVRVSSYWDGFAKSYSRLGPPLRPSDEEVALLECAVAKWCASRRIDAPSALLLGATPDIARMHWPSGTWLTGLDASFPMARSVWPGNVGGSRSMVCGDWLAPPLREASCDVIVGDGAINCLSYPEGFRDFSRTAARLLRGRGLLVLRSYLQATPHECPSQLYDLALAGRIASFHAFKLRLLMALQTSARAGVAVRDAYHWVERSFDLSSLPRHTGWPAPEIETIHYYRDSSTVYAFPTLGELRAALLPRFEEIALLTPAHEMGHRCPILVLQVRPE